MQTLPWLASTGNPDRDRIAAWRTRTSARLVSGPVAEPVDLAFAKAHGVIDHDDADPVLALRLTAAREWVERYLGRACMAQTWEQTVLDGDVTHVGPIFLTPVPVISVTSVTSYNAAGAPTVMSSAGYSLDATSAPARLLLTEGSAWPSGLRTFNSLIVRYVAGYGTDGTNPEAVPATIRQAILLLASEFNERIEAASEQELVEVPFGIRCLLDPYRVFA